MLRSPEGRQYVARAYGRYAGGLTAVLAAAATPADRDVNLTALADMAIAMADGMILQLITIGPHALTSSSLTDVAEGLIHGASH